MGLPSLKLLLNVLFLRQTSVQLQHSGLKPNSHLLVLLKSDFKPVNFLLIARSLLFHQYSEPFDLCVFLDSHAFHISSKFLQVDFVLVIESRNFSLPLSVLLILHLLLLSHLVQMGPLLSLETFSECFETLVVFVGSLAHLLIDLSLIVGKFAIPLVLAIDRLLTQTCNLVVLRLHVFVVSDFLCVQLI